MTDKEALVCLERMAGSGICTEADKIALSALRERIEREKGCNGCVFADDSYSAEPCCKCMRNPDVQDYFDSGEHLTEPPKEAQNDL